MAITSPTAAEEEARIKRQLEIQRDQGDSGFIAIITALFKFLEIFLSGGDNQGEDVGVASNEPPQSAIAAGRALVDSRALPRYNEFRKLHGSQPVSFTSPVKGAAKITSNFGHRDRPIADASDNHKGIDMGARGSDRSPYILAAAEGITLFSGRAKGYGNAVIIGHADGTQTVYGHLTGKLPKVGEEVARGQEIGVMGNEGVSTGTHLHFEVRRDGYAIQPRINGVLLAKGSTLSGEKLPNLASAGVTGGESHHTPAAPAMRAASTSIGAVRVS